MSRQKKAQTFLLKKTNKHSKLFKITDHADTVRLLYDGRVLLVRWGNPPLLLRRHHPRRHDDRLRRHGNLLLGRHASGVLLMRHDDRLLGRHRSRLRRHASLRLV